MGASFALALCWLGCTRVVPAPVELPETATPTAFLLVTRTESGVLAHVGALFGVSEGRRSFGEVPALMLGDDELDLFLVSFSVEALRGAVPGLDDARLVELEERIDSPPPRPVRSVERGLARVDVRLPDGAEVVRIEATGRGSPLAASDPVRAWIIDGITLRVPEDPEHCRPIAGPLSRYGASDDVVGELTQGDRGMRHLNRVVRVDERRVVAASPLGVFLVERGSDATEAAPGQPARHATSAELAPALSNPVIEGLAVAPAPGPDGRRLLLVVGGHREVASGPTLGWAAEVVLGPEGFEAAVTVLGGEAVPLRAAAIDASGRAMILGDGSVVYSRRPGETWQRTEIPHDRPIRDDTGRRLVAAGDPARPFVAGTRARIHVFDAARDAWISETISGVQGDLHSHALAAGLRAGAFELWAGSVGGRVLRRSSAGWRELTLAPPPRYAPCDVSGVSERPAFTRRVDGMALGGDHLFLVADGCAAVLAVRLEDHCVSLITFEGRDAEATSPAFHELTVAGDELVVVGEAGQVWTARLAD